MSGNIKLLGYQDNPYRYLEAADIYITSARYEGHPLAVVEAQSMGLPVIGFNVTGVKDTVVNGVTGITDNKVDVSTLIKLISDSTKKIEKLRQM